MILLRAYASVWDFINSVFGTHFPSLPPQTYGFFLALAFFTGLYFARIEIARKTKLGIFPIVYKTKIEDGSLNWWSIALNSIFAGFIGLKIAGIYSDFEAFRFAPQAYILSLEGSIIGALISIAIVVAYSLHINNLKKPIEPKEVQQAVSLENNLFDLLIIAMVGGISGSKIVDAFDNPASLRQLIDNPLLSLTSGLSILGGLWLVAILFIIYARVNRIKLLPFLDSVAPAFYIAYAVGRLGCQFAGDGCWGIPTTGFTQPWFVPNFLWGNTYAHNVNNDGDPIPNCTEQYCYVLREPHFPTPLYETILVTLLFLVLWRLRVKWTFKFGAITGLFLMLNAFERFIIEIIRVNTKYTYFGMTLSQAQFMSIIMFIMGASLLYYSLSRPSSETSQTV